MYMYEEMIDGRKLTEIVNTEHENVKYLPGIKLPENVVCWTICGVVTACLTWTVCEVDICIFDPSNNIRNVSLMFVCLISPSHSGYKRGILFFVLTFLSWLQVAVPDLLEATREADILVFVLPHQYVHKICSTLKNNIKQGTVAVSLIKVKKNILKIKSSKKNDTHLWICIYYSFSTSTMKSLKQGPIESVIIKIKKNSIQPHKMKCFTV